MDLDASQKLIILHTKKAVDFRGSTDDWHLCIIKRKKDKG